MKLDFKKYEVTSGNDFRLSDYSTTPDFSLSDKESKKIIKANVREIADFQERMFANQKKSVLIIFQAMDAAGNGSEPARSIGKAV